MISHCQATYKFEAYARKMAKCTLKLSFIIFLSFTDFTLVNSSEHIEEVKLNIPTKVEVVSEKVIKGNFKGEKWKSWSDKITIEAKK